MTRALAYAIPLSLLTWTAIGLLALYAPAVLLVLGAGLFLAVAYDVCTEW